MEKPLPVEEVELVQDQLMVLVPPGATVLGEDVMVAVGMQPSKAAVRRMIKVGGWGRWGGAGAARGCWMVWQWI